MALVLVAWTSLLVDSAVVEETSKKTWNLKRGIFVCVRSSWISFLTCLLVAALSKVRQLRQKQYPRKMLPKGDVWQHSGTNSVLITYLDKPQQLLHVGTPATELPDSQGNNRTRGIACGSKVSGRCNWFLLWYFSTCQTVVDVMMPCCFLFIAAPFRSKFGVRVLFCVSCKVG